MAASTGTPKPLPPFRTKPLHAANPKAPYLRNDRHSAAAWSDDP
nr:MAG TPA: hypothetical protein [Caudoviricetes sp.]